MSAIVMRGDRCKLVLGPVLPFVGPLLFAAALLSGCSGDARQVLLTEPAERPFLLDWHKPWPDLADIHFADEATGWAVGDGGTLLKSEDGGETWALQRSGTAEQLTSLYFVDADHGWVTGTRGTLVATRDGGESWEPQEPGTEGDLHRVFFLDRETGWAAGAGMSLLFTANGGRDWSPATGSEPSILGVSGWGGEIPRQLHFFDRDRGLAQEQSGRVWETADGGDSWQPLAVRLPKNGDLSSKLLAFAPSGRGWLLGEDLFSEAKTQPLQRPRLILSPKLFHTADRGAGWSALQGTYKNREELPAALADRARSNFGLPSFSSLTQLAFADSARGWAVELGETVWRTSDGGRSWAPVGEVPVPVSAFAAVDRERLWAVGPRGALLSSGDGGATWRLRILMSRSGEEARIAEPESPGNGRFPAGFRLSYTASGRLALDARGRLWAAGSERGEEAATGRLLFSDDRGFSWRLAASYPAPLHAVFFLDGAHGWLAGEGGLLRRTVDGGESWAPLPGPSETAGSFSSLSFLSPARGWLIADGSLLLATEDGGESWKRVKAAEGAEWADVAFIDERRGWVGGDGEELLLTEDGGASWRHVRTPPLVEAEGVAWILAFAPETLHVAPAESILLNYEPRPDRWTAPLFQEDADTEEYLEHGVAANRWVGWFVGDEGGITATRDGGQSWERVDLSREGLVWTTYSPQAGGLVFSGDGLEGVGEVRGRAPFLHSIRHTETPSGLDLLLTLSDEEVSTVQLIRAEFREKERSWREIPLAGAGAETALAGFVQLSWRPQDLDVATGTPLSYRFTLRDAAGLTYTHQVPAQFTYRSWWSRQPAWRQAALLTGAGYAGYALLACLLLLAAPALVLTLHRLFPGGDLPGKGAVATLLNPLFRLTLIPRLTSSRRVRQAWIRRCQAGKASFWDLEADILAAFAGEADFLDAWVAGHLAAAGEAFERLSSVTQRRTYIPLPLTLGERESGTLVPEPSAGSFRSLFARPEATRLAITARGGAGKSTLACQLGRWALEGSLAPHPMLPVFLEEEIEDLRETVRLRLRELVAAEVPAPALDGLLAEKRLLLILDALSERTPATLQAVRDGLAAGSFGAVVITSRRRLELGALELIPVAPERLGVSNLVFFLTEYLRRTGVDHLFPGRQTLLLGDHLLHLLERSIAKLAVTPLLIRLFVDSAVDALQQGKGLEAVPGSLPEIMLEYLRRVNPQAAGTADRMEHPQLIRAARILGTASLAGAFQPRDFRQDDAAKQLAAAGFGEEPDPIRRLVDNGVLLSRAVAGVTFLRFELDPLAEYLAALEVLDTLRGNRAGWEALLADLAQLPGFPREQQGFLIALEDCLATYRQEFGIPELELPWNTASERGS